MPDALDPIFNSLEDELSYKLASARRQLARVRERVHRLEAELRAGRAEFERLWATLAELQEASDALISPLRPGVPKGHAPDRPDPR